MKILSNFNLEQLPCVITIGNFDANSATKFITVKKPKTSEVEALKHAYYYVDNVTVKLIDSEEECQCIATNQMANVEDYSTLVYAKAANIDENMFSSIFSALA